MQIALERNVPHVACNVWLSGFQMFVLFEVVINEPTFPLSHTPKSNVRYIAFSMRTNTLLTPSKTRYISHLGHTPIPLSHTPSSKVWLSGNVSSRFYKVIISVESISTIKR